MTIRRLNVKNVRKTPPVLIIIENYNEARHIAMAAHRQDTLCRGRFFLHHELNDFDEPTIMVSVLSEFLKKRHG